VISQHINYQSQNHLLYQVVNAIPNQIVIIIDYSTFKSWTICSIYWSLLILLSVCDSLRAIWQLDYQLRLPFWVTISFPNLCLIFINRFLSWESFSIPSQSILCSNPRTSKVFESLINWLRLVVRILSCDIFLLQCILGQMVNCRFTISLKELFVLRSSGTIRTSLISARKRGNLFFWIHQSEQIVGHSHSALELQVSRFLISSCYWCAHLKTMLLRRTRSGWSGWFCVHFKLITKPGIVCRFSRGRLPVGLGVPFSTQLQLSAKYWNVDQNDSSRIFSITAALGSENDKITRSTNCSGFLRIAIFFVFFGTGECSSSERSRTNCVEKVQNSSNRKTLSTSIYFGLSLSSDRE
jgi:hypothetical protein